MESPGKFAIALTVGLAVMVVLLAFGAKIAGEASEPDDTGIADEKDQLWSQRTLDMLVLAVMIFAGALGVLALVGGEFKWK